MRVCTTIKLARKDVCIRATQHQTPHQCFWLSSSHFLYSQITSEILTLIHALLNSCAFNLIVGSNPKFVIAEVAVRISLFSLCPFAPASFHGCHGSCHRVVIERPCDWFGVGWLRGHVVFCCGQGLWHAFTLILGSFVIRRKKNTLWWNMRMTRLENWTLTLTATESCSSNVHRCRQCVRVVFLSYLTGARRQ